MADDDYGQELLRESRAMARAKQTNPPNPPEYTSYWYRLRAINQMDTAQMRCMLSFLAGFTESGWDMAYESSGAPPIYPVEGDIDYAG